MVQRILKISYFSRDWVVGSQNGVLCQLFPLLFYGTTAATLFNIMAVTLNRYDVFELTRLI